MSNMTKAFLNVSTKVRKFDIFGPKFKDFCFCTKLCYKTNQRALITEMRIDSQSCSPKHPNKAFLVPNLKVLIFCLKLQLDKLEGVDYKYDNRF